MVLGYILATGIETIVELGFWSVRKVGSGIYYYYYGEQEKEDEKKNNIQMTDDEIKELRKEISELKDLLKGKEESRTTT